MLKELTSRGIIFICLLKVRGCTYLDIKTDIELKKIPFHHPTVYTLPVVRHAFNRKLMTSLIIQRETHKLGNVTSQLHNTPFMRNFPRYIELILWVIQFCRYQDIL